MAKVFGINGYVSGKIGNTIFAVRAGEQTARQYNPAPANPKSEKQQAQRAKGNVVGRFTKRIPADLLLFNIASAPKRRSFFNKQLLLASKAAKVAGVWQGSVAPDLIVFSNGSLQSDIRPDGANILVNGSGDGIEINWNSYDINSEQKNVIILLLNHKKFDGQVVTADEYFVYTKIVTSGSNVWNLTDVPASVWGGDVVDADAWAVPIDDDLVLSLVGQPLDTIRPEVVADLTTRVGSRAIYGETRYLANATLSF